MASKRCTKCGRVKSLEDFHRTKRSRDGRFSQCKDCKLAYMRQYSASHAGEASARYRAWREANSEHVAADRKAKYWRGRTKAIADAVRWNQENADRRREIANRYARSDKAKRRKAATRWNPTDDVAVDYVAVLRVDPCSYCGETAAGQIDHITPRSLGGSSDWWNLTAACRSCNASKHKRPLLLWLLKTRAVA